MLKHNSVNLDILIQFYKQNSILQKDMDYQQFLLGYISHIYADVRWKTVKKSLNVMQLTPEEIWQEENQVDFSLFKTVDWKQRVKCNLLQAPMFEISQLYAKHELEKWRNQIFAWLENPSNEPNISIKVLTDQDVYQFIDLASHELNTAIFPELLR